MGISPFIADLTAGRIQKQVPARRNLAFAITTGQKTLTRARVRHSQLYEWQVQLWANVEKTFLGSRRCTGQDGEIISLNHELERR
jgi:hypothetical protein